MANNEDRSRIALEKIANNIDSIERSMGSIATACLRIAKTLGYHSVSMDQNLQRIIGQLEISNEPYDSVEADKIRQKMREATAVAEEFSEKTEQIFPTEPRWVEGLPVQVIDEKHVRYGWDGIISNVGMAIGVVFPGEKYYVFQPSQLRVIGEENKGILADFTREQANADKIPPFTQEMLDRNRIAHLPDEFATHFKKGPILNPKQFLQEPRSLKNIRDWILEVGEKTPNVPDPFQAYDAFISWVFEEAARNGIDPKNITFVSGEQPNNAILRMKDSTGFNLCREPLFEIKLPKGIKTPDDDYLWRLNGPALLTIEEFEERKQMMLAHPPNWVVGARVMVVDPTSRRHRQIGLVEALHKDCVDLAFGRSVGDFNYYKVALIENTTVEERVAKAGHWGLDTPCEICAKPMAEHNTQEKFSCLKTLQAQLRQVYDADQQQTEEVEAQVRDEKIDQRWGDGSPVVSDAIQIRNGLRVKWMSMMEHPDSLLSLEQLRNRVLTKADMAERKSLCAGKLPLWVIGALVTVIDPNDARFGQVAVLESLNEELADGQIYFSLDLLFDHGSVEGYEFYKLALVENTTENERRSIKRSEEPQLIKIDEYKPHNVGDCMIVGCGECASPAEMDPNLHDTNDDSRD